MAEVVKGMARHFAQEHSLQHLGPFDLFETFTAYCIVKRFSHDFEPDELRAGGPCDLGIDAYAVIIDGEVMVDPEEIREYIADRKQIQVRFVVIQAKHKIAFDGQTFTKLADGILHVFNLGEELTLRAGKGARRLRECVRVVYEDPRKFEAHGLPRIDVWYASLGRYRPAAHRGHREAAYRRLDNSSLFRLVEVSGAGAAELRSMYRDTAPGVVATLALPDRRRVELPSSPVTGVKRVFIGVVRARDLVNDLLLDEQGDPRAHLYDENLRDFLGMARNTVNQAIAETIADPARHGEFVVLNNGITIVVHSLVAPPDQLVLRGPRVVNGCQTCNVLERNRDKLTDDVLVNVRVIETADPDVVTEIVKATNRQTAIAPDLLNARAGNQQHLEEYCASRPDNREIYFERRLNQYGSSKPRSRVINRRHMIQAYGAMWLGVPHKVSAYRSLSSGKYGPIFAENQDPHLYYVSASAYLNAGRLIGRGVPPQYRPGLFHLVYGLRLLAVGSDVSRLDRNALDTATGQLLDVLWDPDRLQKILETTLLPAIDASVGREGLSGLTAAVRTDLFTERFRRAVLEMPASQRDRLTQAA